MGIQLPGWLRWVGDKVGEPFPEGDETACRRQAQKWRDLANDQQAHKDSITRAQMTTLDGFASGEIHMALGEKLVQLTSGPKSIDTIISQLNQMADAVEDVATQIEFAKEMYIANLVMLAATLAALTASFIINWGAPAEEAAAIAAARLAIQGIIESAVAKVAETGLARVVAQLGWQAVKDAALSAGVNALMSGGLNTAIQTQQMLQNHRRQFDTGSVKNDLESGAISGAVMGPLYRGGHAIDLGTAAGNRVKDFGTGFVANAGGSAAAQRALTGHVNIGAAVGDGALWGSIDGARTPPAHPTGTPEPTGLKGDGPAGLDRPMTAAPDTRKPPAALEPRSELATEPAGQPAEKAGTPPAKVDVPLNLDSHRSGAEAGNDGQASRSHTTDLGTGAPAPRSENPASQPVSDPPPISRATLSTPDLASDVHSGSPSAQVSDAPATRSDAAPGSTFRAAGTEPAISRPADAMSAHHSTSDGDARPTDRAMERAGADTPRRPAEAGPASTSPGPRSADPAGVTTRPGPLETRPSETIRRDYPQPAPHDTRPNDTARDTPRTDTGLKQQRPEADSTRRPEDNSVRQASEHGSEHGSPHDERHDPEHHPESDPSHDAALPPIAVAPVLPGIESAAMHGGHARASAPVTHSPETPRVGGADRGSASTHPDADSRVEPAGVHHDPPGLPGDGSSGDGAQRPDWVRRFVDGQSDPPVDPHEMRELWEHLFPDERADLFRQSPMFGDEAHLRVETCDSYARGALAYWRELMPDDPMYRSIEEAVQQHPDQPHRYLIGFDPDGRSITSIGDPDKATHVAVFVPGTFTDATKLVQSGDHPGYMEVCRRMQARADFELGGAGKTAVVDWQNYHAPSSLVPGAMRHRYAEDGAPALHDFLDRVNETSQLPDSSRTVIGHSYGAAVVGLAAQEFGGLNAHRLITLGGAGMHARSVEDLSLQGSALHAGYAPVWALMHPDDPIRFVEPFDRSPVAHGRMTHRDDFGAHVEWIAEKDGPWLIKQNTPAHSAYWELGSRSLKTIGKIIAGRKDR